MRTMQRTAFTARVLGHIAASYRRILADAAQTVGYELEGIKSTSYDWWKRDYIATYELRSR